MFDVTIVRFARVMWTPQSRQRAIAAIPGVRSSARRAVMDATPAPRSDWCCIYPANRMRKYLLSAET
jgi:hypothetical protein